jgi:hypothetical protein
MTNVDCLTSKLAASGPGSLRLQRNVNKKRSGQPAPAGDHPGDDPRVELNARFVAGKTGPRKGL